MIVFIALLISVIAHMLWHSDFRSKSPNRLAQALSVLNFPTIIIFPVAFNRNPLPGWQAVGWVCFSAAVLMIFLKLWVLLQARSQREVTTAPRVES